MAALSFAVSGVLYHVPVTNWHGELQIMYSLKAVCAYFLFDLLLSLVLCFFLNLRKLRVLTLKRREVFGLVGTRNTLRF